MTSRIGLILVFATAWWAVPVQVSGQNAVAAASGQTTDTPALNRSNSERTMRTETNVPVEIVFTAQHVHPDPFQSVELDVLFTDPRG